MRRSPIAALAAVAYAVILADLLTKLFAVALIGADSVVLLDGVRLGLVFNDSGAFGLPAREFGIEVSTLVTFALILLMLRVCRELAAVDARAPLMLGLITGAGAANHIDMLASPRGVADFIALEIGAFQGIVFNVADLALLAGLLLCARTAGLLVLRIVEERTPALAIAGGRVARRAMPRLEIARETPLWREPETMVALRASSERDGDGVRAVTRATSAGHAGGGRDAGGARTSGLAALFALPSRFDRAATPALVIACTFILVYSLAIVWLPDAGRSAPNALMLALGVFGTVFVAVYAEMALAERREARSARTAALAAEARAERTIFDGSVSGIADERRPDVPDVPRREDRDRPHGDARR